MPRISIARTPLAAALARTLAAALALTLASTPAAAKDDKAKEAPPARSIRVGVLPLVNNSEEIGATKMMEDVLREQVKKVDASRATFLLPADVERILTNENQLDRAYRIAERWAKNGTLDTTAALGIDSVLTVDAILIVKIGEWESHRVPVVGAGQSHTTVGLAMALYDARSMKKLWSRNPREQRFAAELDASSTAVSYDETGVIQRKSDNAPPRFEAVANDLIRDALKKFPRS